MSSELTPEEFATLSELVGAEIAEMDRAAVAESVQGFRASMTALRVAFVSATGPDRGQADG